MSDVFLQSMGLFAGVLTIIAFFPQLVRLIKIKDARSISIPMYLVQITGVAIWVVYGSITHQLAIILTNTSFGFLEILIVLLCIRYRKTVKK